ncbi:MAG: nucleoside monophosphate kinase [Puniceicoccales bacterium]|jgi:adenylate kinase|nr:nucleoside monophosphate kinase [Puniceicoccales bacterium]
MLKELLKVSVFVVVILAVVVVVHGRQSLSEKQPDVNMGKVIADKRAALAESEAIAIALVNRTLEDLSNRFGGDSFALPKQVIFLNGAPGAGKGTNTLTIMRVFEIPTRPIEVSSLLNTPECEKLKSAGELIGDDIVVEKIVDELMKPENANGVIIDGFPRTAVQAYFLKNLISQIRPLNGTETIFRMINFHVSLKTSVERQLARGAAAIAKNKKAKMEGLKEIPVRTTDTSKESAEYRYNTYENSIETCISILQNDLDFYEIDAEGSFDDVKRRVRNSLPELHLEKDTRKNERPKNR